MQNELITRLGAGGQSGRAATAEKALERMREEGLVSKPFVPKKRSFAFPSVERMGCARAPNAVVLQQHACTVTDIRLDRHQSFFVPAEPWQSDHDASTGPCTYTLFTPCTLDL